MAFRLNQRVLVLAGALSIISWGALSIERRDVLVLGVLPIQGTTIVLARLAALAVYTALVENQAAEQGSRRTAMKNATDNAGEVLEHLTRTYNRARQGQITQEIAEIVGGSAALE